MRTKQHNLNPVERTIVASGLLGRVGQRRHAGAYLGAFGVLWADPTRPISVDDDSALFMGPAAGTPGLSGLIPRGTERRTTGHSETLLGRHPRPTTQQRPFRSRQKPGVCTRVCPANTAGDGFRETIVKQGKTISARCSSMAERAPHKGEAAGSSPATVSEKPTRRRGAESSPGS